MFRFVFRITLIVWLLCHGVKSRKDITKRHRVVIILLPTRHSTEFSDILSDCHSWSSRKRLDWCLICDAQEIFWSKQDRGIAGLLNNTKLAQLLKQREFCLWGHCIWESLWSKPQPLQIFCTLSLGLKTSVVALCDYMLWFYIKGRTGPGGNGEFASQYNEDWAGGQGNICFPGQYQ